MEYITKFATVHAAITGEAFLEAGRQAADLLTRNFLKAYAVWWLPPLVLQTGAFLISGVWGAGVGGLGWLLWHGSHPHNATAVRELCCCAPLLCVLQPSCLSLCIMHVLHLQPEQCMQAPSSARSSRRACSK